MTRLDPNKPYNALPFLPPAADIETRPILRSCIEARAALAALKQAGTLFPNQSVLLQSTKPGPRKQRTSGSASSGIDGDLVLTLIWISLALNHSPGNW
jgi:hypothetical protein